MTDGQRRIFFDAPDPRQLILDLADGPGIFVPTRLALGLGDDFTLSVHVSGVSRPLDLPVRVVGRRVPRGAAGLLSTGVQVALARRDHPLVTLMLDLASGSVVDFQSRLRERLRLPIRVTFDDPELLLAECQRLLDGDEALFPGVREVAAGDRVLADVGAHGILERFRIPLEVRGLSFHQPAQGAFMRTFDDDGQAAVREIVNRGAKSRTRRA